MSKRKKTVEKEVAGNVMPGTAMPGTGMPGEVMPGTGMSGNMMTGAAMPGNSMTGEVVEPAATKKSAKKRMSSITRKLHWQLIRSKMGLFFIENLLIITLMSGGWAYMQESHSDYGFEVNRSRSIVSKEGVWDAEYLVCDEAGKELVRAHIFPDADYMIRIIACIFIFQNISIVFGLYGESRRIRKTLKPINEIAIRA
ncbi:MAG: hypothetical protein K6E28_07370, partial [Eubacterium sp.]|nr:hypothetical protein [Eubacterium sp.]